MDELKNTNLTNEELDEFLTKVENGSMTTRLTTAEQHYIDEVIPTDTRKKETLTATRLATADELYLKDSGSRTTFGTGSQKEVVQGRGRYDLLPLLTIAEYFRYYGEDSSSDMVTSDILYNIYVSMVTEQVEEKIPLLYNAIFVFIDAHMPGIYKVIPELAKLYEAGANKYAARDWEKGRPMEVFLNSALRHYFQYMNKETDERHDLAFIWNLVSLIDTLKRLPECAYTLK